MTEASSILAIDTALGATAVCVLTNGGVAPVSESIPMERGHAEAVVPMIERVVSRAPGGVAGLKRIAVTIGPGSFTGIRVGVSAARALGLAWDLPVVGVSTLSALAAPAIAASQWATIAAAIDARHGNVYLQSFSRDGGTQVRPTVLPVDEAVRALGAGPFRLVGSGASMMAIAAWSMGLNADVDERSILVDIAYVARLGLLADPARALPRPLYLKPPDAKPSAGGLIARAP